MMRQLSLMIGGKRYTIRLDEPLAAEVEKELAETFDLGRDNETKTLLQAYLTKQIECLELQQALETLLQKLPD
jgi:CheY-like chemotaxis protein